MKTRNTMLLAALLTAVAGCQTEEPTGEGPALTQHQAVSECGGFGPAGDYDSGGDYCDAEALRWSYDAATQTLELADERVLLNCCGDHTVEAEVVDDVLVVTETDSPEGGDGRCDCLCVFDFALTLDGLEAGTLPLRLVLDVTDEGGPSTAFEGSLDLDLGEGSVVVSDEDAGMWCTGR